MKIKQYFANKYLLIIVVLFVLALLTSIIQAISDPESVNQSLENFSKFLEPLKGRPSYQLFLFIFINNSVKALLTILLFFLFGLYPVMMVLSNGTMIGASAVLFAQSKGIVWFLAAVLPHGILEIPAILLSSALALQMGHLFFLKVIKKEKIELKKELKIRLAIYFKYLLPIFLIAALVEAYITPKVMELVK